MPYTQVFKQLNENLQIAYRQSLDADKQLTLLHKDGHGKFAAIFKKDQGFKTENRLFMPYIKELAEDLEALTQSSAPQQQDIEAFVTKLAVVLSTLQQLKNQLK